MENFQQIKQLLSIFIFDILLFVASEAGIETDST